MVEMEHPIPSINSKTIQIHLGTLTEMIPAPRADFADLKSYNQYKSQCIHQHRQQLLSQFLAQALSAQDLARTEHGKPYLVDHPEIGFNHSHSQQHYALGMSRHCSDIGVDIEDLGRKVRFDALAQHAFDAEEYQHWLESDQDPIYWFKVWTAKEAILKASGLGIRMSLNQLHTQCHPQQDSGCCVHPELGVFHYQQLCLPHAMLSVAWRDMGEGEAPRIELLEGISS
ncbi:4'-phosphopantetheinyl transferase [Acinetobacter calcoaceticus]|uniref:4'-phosphopantetheinyl transferase n=1 Tax=Acinetobacter calcoaceticus TaxID=471 RepID=A0A4R1XN02_ACICA|nr:4'-phosphopantetheinyl transferase [Acinetobacter calcoaceticus]